MINNPLLLSAPTKHSFYISDTAPLPTYIPVVGMGTYRPDRNPWYLQVCHGIGPRPPHNLVKAVYTSIDVSVYFTRWNGEGEGLKKMKKMN